MSDSGKHPIRDSKPKVFISSTVEDFRDLRSSLRYWLEEMGLDVRMSEHNDFDRRPSQNTIDSCLEAIENSDYYILLIGTRRGFVLSGDETITRLEFRHAVELAKQGRINPIVFVREEVLIALKERKAIQQAFPDIEQLSGAPSQHVDDPDFTSSFIDEVRSTAMPGDPGNPPGVLWHYRFKGFGDIVDTLRVTMSLHRNLRRQALLANLKWELEDIIAKLCTKQNKIVTPNNSPIKPLRRAIDLDRYDALEAVPLDQDQAAQIVTFNFSCIPAEKVASNALNEAIRSGEFLEYRQDLGQLVTTQVVRAMYLLSEELARLRLLASGFRDEPLKSEIAGLLPTAQGRRAIGSLSQLSLAMIFAGHDAMENVFRLSFALHRYASNQGEGFEMPAVLPTSPLGRVIEDIEAESVTHDEIQSALDDPWLRDMITGLHTTVAEDVYRALEVNRQNAGRPELAPDFAIPLIEDKLSEFHSMIDTLGMGMAIAWMNAQIEGQLGQNQTQQNLRESTNERERSSTAVNGLEED